MKALALVSIGVCAIAWGCLSARAGEGFPETQLLGRVGTGQYKVYWSCSQGACRLLIDRPATPAIPPLPSASDRPTIPNNQAWVLRSDGTSIAQLNGTAGGAQDKYIFLFPPSARTEAFAVALKFGDHISTWWLPQATSAK
jgi:hypothetical protein